MPVEAAVPPGGIDPAALGLPGASAFDSVLEMLVEEIEGAGLSIDIESFERESSDVDGDPAVDLAELVNPLTIAPVTALSPMPTQVMLLTEAALPSGNATCEQLEATLLENIESAIEQNIPADPRASSELPKQFDELMGKNAADSTDAPAVPPPPKAANPTVGELAPGVQAKVVANANASADAGGNATTQTAEHHRVKPQASQRGARIDRVRAEAPRIDDTPTRPFTVTAVDRAYASRDGDTSSSFDRAHDGIPDGNPQSIGRSGSPASFVVPVDTPGLHLGAKPGVTLVVDAPAAIDQAAETHLPQQIVQSIRLQAMDGGGEAVLRLRPEYLGEVVIAVKVEQGAVIAALQADTPAVRQWAERNEAVLRQSLAEQGLQLERLTVTEKTAEAPLDQESKQRQSREEEAWRQQSRRRRQQADDATFEVTV
jgi:flagellar hook-length control protein FliK